MYVLGQVCRTRIIRVIEDVIGTRIARFLAPDH